MNEMKRHTCVTVGTFDGVHRGHQAVLQTLLSESRRRGLEPMVITFANHPLAVIDPRRAPGRIMEVADEVRILELRGVSVRVLEFDAAMMGTTAAGWISIMKEHYGADAIVMGYDNTFGCDGIGLSIAGYRRLSEEAGVDLVSVPAIAGISSSAIRKSVEAGDVEAAASMLGRPFCIKGTVIHGDALGRTIGFPTANIHVASGMLVPAFGVYAARVSVGDDEIPAVVNVGVRPTVTSASELRIEAHLIDWVGDLYGRAIRVDFIERIRGERKFSSLEALREAIADDTASALRLVK